MVGERLTLEMAAHSESLEEFVQLIHTSVNDVAVAGALLQRDRRVRSGFAKGPAV